MKKNKTQMKNGLFKNRYARIGAIVLIGILLLGMIWIGTHKPAQTITLSEVAAGIRGGEISEITDTRATGEIAVNYQDGRTVIGLRDTSSSLLDQLALLGVTSDQLSKVKFEVIQSKSIETNKVLSTIISLGMLAMVGFVAFRMINKGPMGEKKFEEGEIPDIGFTDVAGMDENMQELQDIVTFLKEGDKYTTIGAKMPRGVLLVGDPGTGKTLLAKAVAGEANVPFYAMSGSEFVEVFVGVGASRVRSLFRKARKTAPCIIFIDEIDAVGRERHGTGSGAEMEQDQTLNQLLVEMDGFSTTEGIIVLAATNRVDVLDPALLRPGRFDRRVYVNRPDVKGREAILQVHIKGKKLAEDVNLAYVAKATPGLVGADLANIVNEAAIFAVRSSREEITMRDFEEAVEKNIAGGVQRKNQVMSEDERKIIAFHEAGHAVAIHQSPLADPVYKITIIPRGQAGGYTMSLPEQDNMLVSKNKILARIIGLMGGRVAEEIFFHDITSGASSDLQVATQLAEEMVMRLGMDSSTGLRVFPQKQGYEALAAPRNSQKTFETIDEAVNNILEQCYADAKRIITEKRAYVERIAGELLEIETMSREQFMDVMDAPVMAAKITK